MIANVSPSAMWYVRGDMETIIMVRGHGPIGCRSVDKCVKAK
jgi:hypothetical protein